MDKAKLPALAQPLCPHTSPAPRAGELLGSSGVMYFPESQVGSTCCVLWAPEAPEHPRVSVLGLEVPEPLDMSKANLDAEHLLAPHEEHVPPWEDEEFPPEEAAPCQQKRWQRVAWPCRHWIQVSSLSPTSALPFCADESEPPFVHHSCLSLGAACPSSLPVTLPVTVPSQAR